MVSWVVSASGSHGWPSCDYTVRLWGSATGAALQTLKGHSNLVNAVTFSRDGKLVASASDDKTVWLWDLATGAALQTLKGHPSQVNAVAFSPDSKLVASASGGLDWHHGSCSRDYTVRLWESATEAAPQRLKGHSDGAKTVAFSPDGKLVVSRSDRDYTVRLWDSATGALLHTLKGHSNRVNTVAFSPDGKLVASASGGHEWRCN
jgi:WD40 repeat protein